MSAPSRVMSFDLDGTLVSGPFGGVLAELEQALPAEIGTGLRRDIFAEHERLMTTDILAAYDWQSIVARRLESLGQDVPFDVVERLQERAAEGVTVIHSETPEHLAALRQDGWRLVLITNGWLCYQEPVLAGAGLTDSFDEILTSDMLAAPKPDPRIFAAAQGNAHELVHVGDRIDHDVVGVHGVGGTAVLLRRDIPADPGEGYVRACVCAEGGQFDAVRCTPDAWARDLGELTAWARQRGSA